MKFQTIALAAALSFGAAAAIAMPNDAMSPAVVKHHSTKHAVKHHGKVHHVAKVRHQHVKHAGRHHAAHMASTSRYDNDGAMSNVSREERMQQSLQKYRSNHS